MLELKNITKIYKTGDTWVTALNGVSIAFRDSEFVSILGPSGCGKTTLLNIIGGLDRYESGVMEISGISTEKYRDRDWDTYRNHTIGFVFQSYNLIPHQSVLKNVELSLTLSGVSRAERRKRAIEVLNRVGLGDQINKKPNQMSGGQMQRVAIARALVNNPKILLADEPTGALDSETSVQIMELLKEIAEDRLVIMVTHNPELAHNYSTRIVNLLDGRITGDTNPYSPSYEQEAAKKVKKPSMSWFTAFSLSLNNLMTKKARTILTAFAGSIGIIGIALILSLSNGVNAYINRVEEDTLSSYPIVIEQSGTNIGDIISELMDSNKPKEGRDENKIYSNNIMTDMMTSMINGSNENNLKLFKEYIENKKSKIKNYSSDIKYSYKTALNVYTPEGYKVNPSSIFEDLGFTRGSTPYSSSMTMSNSDVWQELIDNKELLEKQYEILAGGMPQSPNEVVVIVDKNNQISDYTLYCLGLKDADELKEMIKKAQNGEKLKKPTETSYTFDEILNLRFKVLLNTDYYKINDMGTYDDMSEDELYLQNALGSAREIRVAGILKAQSNSAANTSSSGSVGYLSSLMTELINEINKTEIVEKQKEKTDIDVFTGLPFATDKEYTMEDLNAYVSTLPQQAQLQFKGYISSMRAEGLDDKQIVLKFENYLKAGQSSATYEDNCKKLGISDLEEPSGISIYPKDFNSKEDIANIINKYNRGVKEKDRITYTDYIGLMLSSVTTIINAISYILIAFVSISLVVSSIMIGIITYISVLERTKEIGILRAMGASKRDISNVFNAETIIIGLFAGGIGIGVTLLLLIPINAIIEAITNIGGLAVLPTAGGIALVIISMLLTFIAGLLPSRMAAKRDPVIALRTE
ncbi:MAG: ABC transporter ATP-binding protein/permease [Clostridia bacterium]|nr:ABC transporter ATP-binding protein/permease [Clostridia bacterium]